MERHIFSLIISFTVIYVWISQAWIMIEKHQQKLLWQKFKQESIAIEIEFPLDPPS